MEIPNSSIANAHTNQMEISSKVMSPAGPEITVPPMDDKRTQPIPAAFTFNSKPTAIKTSIKISQKNDNSPIQMSFAAFNFKSTPTTTHSSVEIPQHADKCQIQQNPAPFSFNSNPVAKVTPNYTDKEIRLLQDSNASMKLIIETLKQREIGLIEHAKGMLQKKDTVYSETLANYIVVLKERNALVGEKKATSQAHSVETYTLKFKLGELESVIKFGIKSARAFHTDLLAEQVTSNILFIKYLESTPNDKTRIEYCVAWSE